MSKVEAFTKADHNPFQLTVEQQLDQLVLAIAEEAWNIPAASLSELERTAPADPHDPQVWRSFRIRLAEGKAGVRQTFEAHVERNRRVYGENRFRRDSILRSDEDHLRYLGGHQRYQATVEWVLLDLHPHREEWIPGTWGIRTLADEILVFAWLFKDYMQAVSPELPAYSYELHVPESERSRVWGFMPCAQYTAESGIEINCRWSIDDRQSLPLCFPDPRREW